MDRNEALEILRKSHDKFMFAERAALETLIPELKESEDERIRMALINHFKSHSSLVGENWNGIECDDIIAYLEKQKEPKPSIFPPGLGEVHFNPILCEQKEQKPRKFKLGDKVHWHDDDTNVITITGFRDDAYLTDSAYGPILFCDEDNWERIEQKSAEPAGKLSREEYLYQLLIDQHITYSDYEYLIGQKPAEWSEEDERNIRNLESILYYDKKLSEETRVELGNFLKSLRPSWKPSGEQMEALDTVLEHEAERVGSSKALEKACALSEQIKKRM